MLETITYFPCLNSLTVYNKKKYVVNTGDTQAVHYVYSVCYVFCFKSGVRRKQIRSLKI